VEVLGSLGGEAGEGGAYWTWWMWFCVVGLVDEQGRLKLEAGDDRCPTLAGGRSVDVAGPGGRRPT